MAKYKCVPGPKRLVVNSSSDMAQAVAQFSELINQNCVDGWDFYSLEEIAVTRHSGWLARLLGAKETTTFHNMLVFRKADPVSASLTSNSEIKSSTKPTLDRSSQPLLHSSAFRLVMGSAVYPLPVGACLTTEQIQISPTGQSNIATVLQNPQDPTQVGLRNLSTAIWQVKAANGSVKAIQPGQVLRLLNGLLIQFSDTVQGDIKGSEPDSDFCQNP